MLAIYYMDRPPLAGKEQPWPSKEPMGGGITTPAII